MDILDTRTWKRFNQWIKDQHAEPTPTLLIHDKDGDGLSSGKILIEALGRREITVTHRVAADERTNIFPEKVRELISKNHIKTIFTTDLNLLSSGYPTHKEELKHITLISFDHHETPVQIDSNVLYFHPSITFHFPDSSQYCTSKLVYDLLSQLVDLTDLAWVASIGILADANYKTWGDFVDATEQNLGIFSAEESPLRRAGSLLYYALVMDEKVQQKALNLYFKAHSYTEILEGLPEVKVVEEEIKYHLRTWGKKAEKQEDIVFLTLKPKYKIGGIISTKLSFQYPHQTFVVITPSTTDLTHYSISTRRQDGKVNLSLIMKELRTFIPASTGGGHPPAAGASCPKDSIEQWKEKFREMHKKNKAVIL